MKRITSRKKKQDYIRMGAHYSLGTEWQTI